MKYSIRICHRYDVDTLQAKSRGEVCFMLYFWFGGRASLPDKASVSRKGEKVLLSSSPSPCEAFRRKFFAESRGETSKRHQSIPKVSLPMDVTAVDLTLLESSPPHSVAQYQEVVLDNLGDRESRHI